MKQVIAAAVIALCAGLLFSGAASAQSSDAAGTGRHEMKGGRGGHDEAASLTEAQKATVKSILSKYTDSSLTADDAKAIHRAFRDAGIHRGPGLREAITSAGFDPEKLRELDPPPDRRGGGEGGPDGSAHGRKGSGQGRKQDGL